MTDWKTIDSAPKDGTKILAYFNHDADTYVSAGILTDYASEAESGNYMIGKGYCISVWQDGWMDGNPMEGEPEYWVPGNWYEWINDEPGVVCNATHWKALEPPKETAYDRN